MMALLRPCLLMLILAVCACENENEDPAIDIDHLTEPVRITKWALAGPFFPDTHLQEKDYINKNFIPGIIKEEDFRPDRLEADDSLKNTFRNVELTMLANPNIDLIKYYKIKRPALAYFATKINCSKAGTASLLFNAFQKMKLWVNGEFVYESGWKPSNSKFYEEYVPVKLKKGANLLLAKVAFSDTSSAHWKFNAHLTSLKNAKTAYLKDFGFFFVERAVLAEGQNLSMYLGPFINDVSIKIELTDGRHSGSFSRQDFQNITVKTGTAELKIDPVFKDRLVDIKIITAERDTIAQSFFYGDFKKAVFNAGTLYRKLMLSSRCNGLKTNTKAVYERLLFAMDKKVPGKEEAKKYSVEHWDRTRIWFYKDLCSKNELLRHQNCRSSDDKGIIKAYPAKEKNNYYLFYAGPKQTRKPLLVIIPFPSRVYTPLLESWALSNFYELEPTFKLADEHNFAVIWPDPESYNLNEKDIRKIFSSIHDARKYADIDTNRIFLLGNCSASPNTLRLAEMYPEKFAGCALVNPVRIFDADLSRLHKMHLIFKLSVHDEVIPVEQIRAFYEKNKSKMPGSKFILSKYGSHYVAPKDNNREIFEYFNSLKINK